MTAMGMAWRRGPSASMTRMSGMIAMTTMRSGAVCARPARSTAATGDMGLATADRLLLVRSLGLGLGGRHMSVRGRVVDQKRLSPRRIRVRLTKHDGGTSGDRDERPESDDRFRSRPAHLSNRSGDPPRRDHRVVDSMVDDAFGCPRSRLHDGRCRRRFDGVIDNLRIWSAARTADQIAAAAAR
jgi:hypothetical protein